MTVVFGAVDFPVWEILIVATGLLILGTVLLLVAIYFVLRELRELKVLFMHEESKINRFEKDISKLEELEKTKNIDALKDYIGHSMRKGEEWDKIKKDLVSQGWDHTKLDRVYKYVLDNYIGLKPETSK